MTTKTPAFQWFAPAFLGLGLLACTDDSSGTSVGLGVGESCTADSDCAAWLECEIEHGVSSCQPHGAMDLAGDGGVPAELACAIDSDCPAGLECELEHGAGLCVPHGGAADDPAGPVSDPAAPVSECTSDADCGAGLECELEHGAGACVPHGGTPGEGVETETEGPDPEAETEGPDPEVETEGPTPEPETEIEAGAAGAPCTTTADCAAGLECELEHGAWTCDARGR